MEGVAEISGSLSGAGLILILTVCLTIYGSATFQSPKSQVGVKTLSGGRRPQSMPHEIVSHDPLQDIN